MSDGNVLVPNEVNEIQLYGNTQVGDVTLEVLSPVSGSERLYSYLMLNSVVDGAFGLRR